MRDDVLPNRHLFAQNKRFFADEREAKKTRDISRLGQRSEDKGGHLKRKRFEEDRLVLFGPFKLEWGNFGRKVSFKLLRRGVGVRSGVVVGRTEMTFDLIGKVGRRGGRVRRDGKESGGSFGRRDLPLVQFVDLIVQPKCFAVQTKSYIQLASLLARDGFFVHIKGGRGQMIGMEMSVIGGTGLGRIRRNGWTGE